MLRAMSMLSNDVDARDAAWEDDADNAGRGRVLLRLDGKLRAAHSVLRPICVPPLESSHRQVVVNAELQGGILSSLRPPDMTCHSCMPRFLTEK